MTVIEELWTVIAAIYLLPQPVVQLCALRSQACYPDSSGSPAQILKCQLHPWRLALHTVLLCKTGSQQAECHCSYTQGDLLFIQAHSRQSVTVVTPMETCSSYRLTAGSVSLQLHIWTVALHTVTPTETCSSYRCAVTQHKCTAALFRAKCSFHCSILLCKTGSQQAECHCSYTHGDLLFIQGPLMTTIQGLLKRQTGSFMTSQNMAERANSFWKAD
ncbi:TPA: hypothetical protein ACH3X1_013665 [Trebouxia sp. C0004]